MAGSSPSDWQIVACRNCGERNRVRAHWHDIACAACHRPLFEAPPEEAGAPAEAPEAGEPRSRSWLWIFAAGAAGVAVVALIAGRAGSVRGDEGLPAASPPTPPRSPARSAPLSVSAAGPAVQGPVATGRPAAAPECSICGKAARYQRGGKLYCAEHRPAGARIHAAPAPGAAPEVEFPGEAPVPAARENGPSDPFPTNGTMLVDRGSGDGLGSMRIVNNTDSPAVVKLVESGRLRYAVFVAADSEAVVSGVDPDTYELWGCFGKAWSAALRRLTGERRAWRAIREYEFAEEADEEAVEYHERAVALLTVIEGSLRTRPVRPQDFDAVM